MGKDFYTVLSLPQTATDEQIRTRFRELVRERHPDRFQGEEKEKAEIEFQEITEAVNVLTNPERRRQHDLELVRPDNQRSGSDPAQLARVYLQHGIKAYRAGKYLEAAENFDRATRVQPKSARAWHFLAQAASRERRRLSQATNAAAKACEIEPMNANYLKEAGRVFEQAGMNTRAVGYYEQALKWGGEDPEVEASLERLAKGAGKGSKQGFFGKIK